MEVLVELTATHRQVVIVTARPAVALAHWLGSKVHLVLMVSVSERQAQQPAKMRRRPPVSTEEIFQRRWGEQGFRDIWMSDNTPDRTALAPLYTQHLHSSPGEAAGLLRQRFAVSDFQASVRDTACATLGSTLNP